MTTEQINIAIAQACGWTDTEIVNEGGKLMYGQTEVPNYCGDLNDMWAAETHLTPDQQVEFVYQLSEIVAQGGLENDYVTVCREDSGRWLTARIDQLAAAENPTLDILGAAPV